MKWIEIIGLRSADGNSQRLTAKLNRLIAEIEKESEQGRIRVYRRIAIDSDVCIHLAHDAKPIAPGGSRLGLRLVAELKELGLIHHSVWSEMHASDGRGAEQAA